MTNETTAFRGGAPAPPLFIRTENIFITFNTTNMNSNNSKNASHIRELLIGIGEDVRKDGLIKTPERVAASLSFLTSGRSMEKEIIKDCQNALFEENIHSSIAVKDIEFYSLCEHHMLPFWGSVSIAFIPNKNGKILGLSKFGRLVDVFSRRLQVQERLGTEVLRTAQKILKPQAMCIRTEAKHFCMMMRGVEKHASTTVTYEFKGNKKFELSLKDLLR